MALLTTITDAAWPTSGTPTAGNTGFESCASTGTLMFSVDENGDKFITTTATNEKIYIRVDGTAAVFASGETRYQVEVVAYLEFVGQSADNAIGSPSGFIVDLDGAGGRGVLTMYATNRGTTTGLYGIPGGFAGATAGAQMSGMDVECIPVNTPITFGTFGDRTAGIAGVCLNGVRWVTWTATPASNNWGNSFTFAFPNIPGGRWRVYATSARPARSWTGTTHTFSPTEGYTQYADDTDELVMSWPHVATDGLHGSFWTYSGTCALTDYASGGINPSRKRIIGGSGGVVATSVLNVGDLQFNEYGDMAFVTSFYVPSGTYSIAFRNAANTADILKLTATSGELRNTAGTALTASDSAAISIATDKRYHLAVNFTNTGAASFTILDATAAPTARVVWSNTVATTSAVTTLGKIIITASQNVEADRVDICRWWANGICDSLVSASATGVTPALKCCSNNLALAFPQRDSLSIPGIAHGCKDLGWPKDTWLITSAHAGYSRAAWAQYSRAYMTHTHAMKLVAVDGACFNDFNGGSTASAVMDMVEDDVAFCETTRNRIILMQAFMRPHALATSLSTTEFLQQQQYNDLLKAYWDANRTNARLGFCNIVRSHPLPMLTTDGAHPTTTGAANGTAAIALSFENGEAIEVAGSPGSRPIGPFTPGATIDTRFRYNGTQYDLSTGDYSVTVYRNGETTGEAATIGTATATSLPFTYVLPDSFVVGNTGIIDLEDVSGTVLYSLTFGVIASATGGGTITILTDAMDGVSPLNAEDEPRPIYRGRSATLGYSFAAYSGDVEDGDTLTLRVMPLDSYEDQDDTATLALAQTTATASIVDGYLTATFTLTAEQTADLPAGAKGDGATDYRLQVLPAANGYPLLDRRCEVRRAMGTPA